MEKIIHNIIKKKTTILIKELGNGLNELVFNIHLDMGEFNTIEYVGEKIILHIFKGEDYDIVFDYDILSEEDKLKIIKSLKLFSTPL